MTQGIALSTRSGLYGDLIRGYVPLARIHQAGGDWPAAQARLAQAAQIAGQHQAPHDAAYVAAWQARLWLGRRRKHSGRGRSWCGCWRIGLSNPVGAAMIR